MNQQQNHSTATLSNGALTDNARFFRSLLKPPTRLCAVIKANAYGHGIQFAIDSLINHVDYFAVATNHEAIEAHSYTKGNKPILVLGELSTYELTKCLRLSIEFSVCSLSSLRLLHKAAMHTCTKANVHIKINTGMNRFGVSTYAEFKKMLGFILGHPQLNLRGVYTHFGSGDLPSHRRTAQQADIFKKYLRLIPPSLSPIIHAANTDTTLNFPHLHFDMVRVGIGLYGYASGSRPELHPVLSLSSKIIQLQKPKQNTYIGYSNNIASNTFTKIGIIPLGYADGISRALSNKGVFIVNDKFTPIIGSVCMDSCIVDLSHVSGAKIGTTATFIGSNLDLAQTADDVARSAGTIPYEILTGLNHSRISFTQE